MKTSELIGPALDWAVAKCEGVPLVATDQWTAQAVSRVLWGMRPGPSRNWSQGGPIIERECIALFMGMEPERGVDQRWGAFSYRTGSNTTRFGPTPLVAAMRCYVANKLGDEVDIPEELQ